MQTYGSLNLRKLRDDNGLDFAHYTYLRRQCSCCYGPEDLPDRYWAKGKKPILNGDKYTPSLESTQYILFKNAANGSGTVTRNDIICKRNDVYVAEWRRKYTNNTQRVYISWQFPIEKMDGVLQSLREQLDDDYVILRPRNSYYCIEIVFKDDIRSEDKPHIFTPKGDAS